MLSFPRLTKCGLIFKAIVIFARIPNARVLEFTSTLLNTKIYFLLEKYGVVPKKCFTESHTTEATRRMNDILNHKVQPKEQAGIEFTELKTSH